MNQPALQIVLPETGDCRVSVVREPRHPRADVETLVRQARACGESVPADLAEDYLDALPDRLQAKAIDLFRAFDRPQSRASQLRAARDVARELIAWLAVEARP
ncbi:MAG: hypothetical protein AB1405_03625 [Bdellovibrionota bacterium]